MSVEDAATNKYVNKKKKKKRCYVLLISIVESIAFSQEQYLVAHLALALVTLVATAEKLPLRSPRSVGMSAERLATIDRVVRRGITAGGYPGASVVIGRRGAAVMQKGFGHLGWTTSSPDVDADKTIYDLASLSKVIGTTTAAMILFDEGRLDLDAPVSSLHPRVRRR